MPCISADKFTSPILKKIANGDESVFSGVPGNDFNLTEMAAYREWSPLFLACNNGHIHIVNRLLEIPAVVDNVTDVDNRALCLAAENGHLNIVDRLLEIPQVQANATAIDSRALLASVENGHLNVVNRLLERLAFRWYHTYDNNYVLRTAVCNGHLDVVNRLLEVPEVVANAAALSNIVLRMSAYYGHLHVVNRLLEIPAVVANSTALGNESLCRAVENGDIHAVNRFLEIPAVAANTAARDNYALRSASENGYFEIAHTLAKLQWPRGKIDMPYDLHQCLPAIHQGAIIYSGRKESENLVKCWIRGNPTNNTSDIHYPSHNESSQEHVLIDINTAPRLIMQYAGCIDVAREAGNESRADHVMNSLLYSSRLHKTFQTAYENGQRESRERLGYGDGAVVVYNPGRPKPGM
jgi:ankyrin repeat protein